MLSNFSCTFPIRFSPYPIPRSEVFSSRKYLLCCHIIATSHIFSFFSNVTHLSFVRITSVFGWKFPILDCGYHLSSWVPFAALCCGLRRTKCEPNGSLFCVISIGGRSRMGSKNGDGGQQTANGVVILEKTGLVECNGRCCSRKKWSFYYSIDILKLVESLNSAISIYFLY